MNFLVEASFFTQGLDQSNCPLWANQGPSYRRATFFMNLYISQRPRAGYFDFFTVVCLWVGVLTKRGVGVDLWLGGDI